MVEMQFKIHSHACLEVINDGISLLCDPWLIGSAYWRSWWNYPPLQEDVLKNVDPQYIYISHLHWDHFHGPTLKKLGTHRKIIIPKIPELRLLQDLQDIGFKDILEIEHSQTIEIAKGFEITSYQFMPLFSDSAIVIKANETVLFNCNDAKFMGLPLQQILKRHPQIDFAFRSHSSANSRVCYEVIDEDNSHIDNIEKYSEEFALFAKAVNAKYAIPFASNQCCLHPETIEFNHYNNYAYKVLEYFKSRGIDNPQCVLMAPGDTWNSLDGFHIKDNNMWYTEDNQKIHEYRQQKSSALDKTITRESKSKLNRKLAERYANWILSQTPWFVKMLFKAHPFTIIGHSDIENIGLHLDLYKNEFKFVELWDDINNPIQVHVNNAVINDVWAKKHWNSLGVSKRLKVRLERKSLKYYSLFAWLNIGLEVGSIQPKYIFSIRYLSTWLRRWRELFLYVQIVFNSKFLGKKFEYKNYL
jgi:UDP-MurNAc hydroxylase